MPSDQSIPHGQQRPDVAKRHAKIPTSGSQHRANDVENMSVEELDWQIEKTQNELLDMTRLLMRQCNQYNQLVDGTRDGQWIAGWLASRAHWPGDVNDLEAANDRWQEGILP